MAITIDEFEDRDGDALEFGEDTQADRILRFLAERSDRAFTQSEINEATGIKRGSVGAVLSRLEQKELVRHKGRYWAATSEVADAHGGSDGVSFVTLL